MVAMVAMVAVVVGENVCYTCNEMINKLSPQLHALIMCPQILNSVGVYLTSQMLPLGGINNFKCAVVLRNLFRVPPENSNVNFPSPIALCKT